MGSQSDRSSDMMLAGAIANSILRLLICIAAVFVVTALLNTVSLRDRPLSAVLIFLFLVLIVSTAWGFHYALFVSLLAALGFSHYAARNENFVLVGGVKQRSGGPLQRKEGPDRR